MWPFSQKPASPAIVPTDTVIPLHYWDDTFIMRALVVDLTFRFDDVLDPEKIRNALVRLMEIGNWRKLGARLRMNAAGKLEYHIPASYDEERPGFIYSHVRYDMDIEDHPLASQLPRATDHPSVQANPEQFRSLARRPDSPKKLDDYLSSDEPQLSLHIVSFENSTLVSTTWSHTLSDIMGQGALFNAWALVLNGKEDQVPPFHGFEADPLANLDSSTVEESIIARYRLKGLSMLLFVLRLMFELLWWYKEDNRIVCLPSSYIQAMKQTAMKELAAQNNDNCKQFVSDGDTICSWWARLALQHLGPTSNRTVNIANAFGLRELLAKDLLPASTAYVPNAMFAVHTITPASELFQRPLSFVASQIRRSIQEQGTRSQMEAFAALNREEWLRNKRPCVFGDSSTQLITFSNWTKAKLFEVDFSSSVTKQGFPIKGQAYALGRPSCLFASAFVHRFPLRYSCPIFGKDLAGNYWLAATLRASTWQKIEEDFAAMYEIQK